MIDYNLLRVGNILSFVFYYWRLLLDEIIGRQDIYLRAVTATIKYGCKNDRENSLWTLFFYIYFRKQMSRERLAPTHPASISTIHIFRHVTDQFCYFPPLLSLFFTQPTSLYNESKRNTSKKKREKEGETERRRETRVTRKRKWDTTGPHCPDEWVNGQWRSTLKK